MELLIQPFFDVSREVLHFLWLPLIIWTLLTTVILIGLKYTRNIHVQYHYHIRLALIFALPAGLGATWLLESLSVWFSTESSLKIISVFPVIEAEISATDTTSVLTPTYLYAAVLFAALAGTGYSLLNCLRQWIQLAKLKNKLSLFNLDQLDHLSPSNAKLADQTGRTIQIGITSKEIIPVTFGMINPVILVPESLVENPEKMNLAIRHELTHIINRDFPTHLAVIFIKSLFWFHPLIHLLSHQLVTYREMRCDSEVISDPSVSKKLYASLLFELLPIPNLKPQISIKMAQQPSNLKQRIERISHQDAGRKLPHRASIMMMSFLMICLTAAMACTDMQTQTVFDEEELDLMTNIDRTGERGYHEIMIFMGDKDQIKRHEESLSKLDQLEPEYVREVEVLKDSHATEQYGDRASNGIIIIRTKPDQQSYNAALQALGMEPETLPSTPEEEEDFFVVVEEMPELIGGLASIQQHITYPEAARQAGIEGRVYIQFIVNEQGEVENPQVIRGIGGGADEVALDAVKQAKFTPGKQRGKPVRVQYSLPVQFKLQPDTQTENDET